MEFSLFNLMTLPSSGVSHAEVFQQTRTLVSMAEEGGFDVAWMAEHHLSSYSISSSPLSLCSHMAGYTKRIKLGPAVVVLPFYEPLRLIEDIFMTDQLLEGRFVLGLGTGYQPREFEKFDIPYGRRLEHGLEIWAALLQAQETGVIDFDGEFVSIRDAALSIEPFQQTIPTFVVGSAPEIRRLIIKRGATALMTPGLAPPAVISTVRDLLSETAAETGKIDDFPYAVQRMVFVTKDKDQLVPAAKEALRHGRYATNMRQEQPAMTGAVLESTPFEGEPSVDEILDRCLIGGPEEVAEQLIGELSTNRITHFSAFMQFADMPYGLVQKSMELFIEEVMPAVKSRL